MHAEVLDEPELEFGGGGRHIDPGSASRNYGPADLGAADAPRAIRVGLIGPADQLGGLRAWLERCREPIPAKDERYPHLFPDFPAATSTAACTPRWCSATATPARSATATCAPSPAPAARRHCRRPSTCTRTRSPRSPRRTVSTCSSSPARAARDTARRGWRRRRRTTPSAEPGDDAAAPVRELPRPAQGAAAAAAAADPDHPPQHLGRGRPAARPAQPPGRGQPRLEPARRPVLQGRRRALAAARATPTDLTACYVGVSSTATADGDTSTPPSPRSSTSAATA